MTDLLDIPEYGPVSMIVDRPRGAIAGMVFAHGAGAPMTHAFMEAAAEALRARKIAVMRYNYHYADQAGRRRPDAKRKLEATTTAALAFAKKRFRGLPLFAGGKSMGGRITAQVVADKTELVEGLIFYGFPLHAPGADEPKRQAVIETVASPMLFIQGERDKLAKIDLLKPICRKRRITLKVIEQGDHSLKVPKRTGLTADDVHEKVADWVLEWIQGQLK